MNCMTRIVKYLENLFLNFLATLKCNIYQKVQER